MRLTDADGVLADIDALKSSPWFKAEYISDERRLGMKEALDMISACIRHAPTVDAVPVEWIENYLRNYRYMAPIEKNFVREMIKAWAERKEE